MRDSRTRTPWRWSAFLAGIGLLGTACTSPPEGADTPAPTEQSANTTLGQKERHEPVATWGHITGVRLVEPDTVELTVAHGACDTLQPIAREDVDAGEVTIGVNVIGDWSETCHDVGLEDTVTLVLSEPLSDRTLVLNQPSNYVPDNELSPCFETFHGQGCHPYVVETIAGRAHVLAPVQTNDISISFGPDTPPLTIGDKVAQIRFSESLSQPLVQALAGADFPDQEVTALASIHNYERTDSGERLDYSVAGFDAFQIHDPHGDDPTYSIVAVQAGPWWIDISLWSSHHAVSPIHYQTTLEQLTITQSPGDLPRVSGPDNEILPVQEVVISDASHGLTLVLDPNCAHPTAFYCIPDAGFAYPTQVAARGPGLPPGADGQSLDLPLPSEITVDVLDWGPTGELVSCSGSPALDGDLLTAEHFLTDATDAISIYTGITEWTQRQRPGRATWFTGDSADPEVVASYVPGDNGSWRAKSVTICD